MSIRQLKHIYTGSAKDRWDLTKRLSDYVGVITRVLFLAIFTSFVVQKMNLHEALSGNLYAIGIVILFLLLTFLNLILLVSFCGLTVEILWDTLWIESTGVKPSKLHRWLSRLGQVLAVLVLFCLLTVVQFLVPSMVFQMANDEAAKYHHDIPMTAPSTSQEQK